jgi:hypothetical protein
MKIYIHYELGQPEFTLPIHLGPENRTVAELRDDFIRAYNSRFPSNLLEPEEFGLAQSSAAGKRKQLLPNQPILPLAKPNLDIFVIKNEARKTLARDSAIHSSIATQCSSAADRRSGSVVADQHESSVALVAESVDRLSKISLDGSIPPTLYMPFSQTLSSDVQKVYVMF